MADDTMTIRVECYAGYRGEETPRRFYLGEQGVGVRDVVDRWLGPEQRYFKVRGDDGAVYILRHDEAADRWDLTLYHSQRLNEVQPSSSA